MARKVSPTTQAIKNQSAKQLDIPPRQKPVNGRTKRRGETRNSNPSSKEEIQHLKEQLAQRDAQVAHLLHENQLLIKEKGRRATELQIINNIGQTLTEGLDLNSTLERVGERLREALQLKSVGIIANDSQTGLAITYYLYHYGERVFPENFSPNRNRLAMRFALKMGGKPLVVNTNAEKYWRKIVGDMLVWPEIPRSFIIVPLLAGKQLVGSITIGDYEEENAFLNLPIDLLETIASNLGTAIQNVRLFDETQRLLKETEQRHAELAVITSIQTALASKLDFKGIIDAVGDKLSEIFEDGNVGIGFVNEARNVATLPYVVENGKRLDYFEISLDVPSVLVHTLKRRRPLVINRNISKRFGTKVFNFPGLDQHDLKSWLSVPLMNGDKFLGGIALRNWRRENAYSESDVRLLQTIANSMSVALENVNLFEETQRLLKETQQRATELQIINNIGQTLTEGLDLDSTLERVGKRLHQTLGVDDFGITAFDTQTGLAISHYIVRKGKRVAAEYFSLDKYRLGMRLALKMGGKPWVVNTNAEKYWDKIGSVTNRNEAPKSFAMLPMLAGKELVGSITFVDFERENAFPDLPLGMLETLASNMGTAIQNVRLFDQTRRLFKEAEEARASAEQANKAKSTFLANMSHELRTPLNAIIGFTRIVKRKAEGTLPEKQIENLDKVLVSSEHLLGLINTVLDIAKIEAGRMDVIPSKFSLASLADQCATLAMPLLKPHVTLEKQVDETLGLIFSDQDKIKQILLNLLSNAAKFTNEGNILLSVQKNDHEQVSVSVRDSGIGISEEALGRVFEEFQQADNTTTREYGGTGLGLTISRNLARLLGGDLTAASEPGKGSTFTLTLPIHYGRRSVPASHEEPDSVRPAAQAEDRSTSHRDDRDSLKTLLIVEDTEFNIQLLTQLLESDYNLLVAKDGAQGVTMAQKNNPDLILMDISLPIIDGYEATRRIRVTHRTTPIIGLSAHAMSGDAEKAKQAGCNEYMTKPIDESLLIEKLNQYLR